MPRPSRTSRLSRTSWSSRIRRSRRAVRRSVLARRRPLAAVCAACAVAAALQATSAPPPPRTMVLTAAHDVPAGAVLRRADLVLTPFAPDSVPAGVLAARSVLGRTTTVPMLAGEPVTVTRVVAPSLVDGFPGLAAVPLRIGDPGAVRLLRVGDRVDLLAADPQGEGAAEVVGHDLPVLAIPRVREESPGLANGALVVLGVPDGAVRTVAQASVSAFLSVVVTR